MVVAEGIKKSYNGETVIHGISLTVRDGEFVAVMGESGSGKSTLISILGGFLRPDEGRVLWDGVDISTLDDKKMSALRSSKVGFVFQSFKLIPTLNVNDNLLLPAVLGKKADKEALAYVKKLTEELKVASLLDKYPDELSGGQMQRIAIIRALAYKPSLLILDEPTGALDSENKGTVMGAIRRAREELGTTVVLVTHSRAVAELADRIICIKDGVIER